MADPKDKKPPPSKLPPAPDRETERLRDTLPEPAETERLVDKLRTLPTLPPTFANSVSGSLLTQLNPATFRLPSFDDTVLQRARVLEDQITALRRKLDEQARALQAEKESASESEARIAQLEAIQAELRQKERLGFLLSRVNEAAQRMLLESEEFTGLFAENSECTVYVMSVDIRRSTELMLKARRAEHFASFITTLCSSLLDIVRDSYGVVDKFTGDGILAFFPDFYSGPDAGYYVLHAAAECHRAFDNHYRASRKFFSSVLMDVGLSIGVDYGATRLVQVAGGLTVVGTPVVYACRLSGGPARSTLLNQPAYEQISERLSAHFFIEETAVEIKHEGRVLAYAVKPTGGAATPAVPSWVSALARGAS